MNEYEHVWGQAILPANSSIKQAVEVLDRTSLRIVLVTDASGVLLGTISDGDIRRGLLRGLELASPIQSIIHGDAIVVPHGKSREQILKLMTQHKIQQIPIVDEMMHVTGLHLWDQINSAKIRSNLMVIMAGGKGTRMHPKTENCPKALLLVAGKPILEHIIERARAEGFSQFVLVIHHLGHMIESYFEDGERFNVKIQYLREETPLGTAGGLSLIMPRPESAFIVTNGDVLTDVKYGNLLDYHNSQKAVATMSIRTSEWQNPFGVVQTNGLEIVGYEEKPITKTNVNAGVYALEPAALELLDSSKPCDMPELFQILQSQNQRTIVYPVYENWIDIGRPSDLEKANSEVDR